MSVVCNTHYSDGSCGHRGRWEQVGYEEGFDDLLKFFLGGGLSDGVTNSVMSSDNLQISGHSS